MSQNNIHRREFIVAASLISLHIPLRSQMTSAPSKPKQLLLYIGTYTSGQSKGIYTHRFDLDSGALTPLSATSGIVNPSFLAVDSKRRYLYAVNEIDEFEGKPGGAVSAFATDQKSGALRFLNQQPSRGAAPCFVTVDASGKYILTANYTGGSVIVLPVGKDGTLGEATDFVQHVGSGPNVDRQTKPHAHSIILDQANAHAYAADLGLDKLLIYDFDKKRGKLTPHDPPFASVKPGAGPRHFTFHPSQKYAFVINELDSTITAFTFDPKSATLKEIHTVSTLPPEFKEENSCADIHVSPSGKFLYGSNRGHDSIVVFQINETNGRLTFVQHESTQGKIPRNFAIDPTGAFLLAANQDSDSIVTFRLDPVTGRLTPTGQVTDVPSPVCLKFSEAV